MSRVAVSAGAAALGPYSDAIVANGMLLLSGRIGLVEDGLATGVRGQTLAAIANAEQVLAAAGLGLDDVVRCVVYLVDMADFAGMNDTYASRFSRPTPARTTIAVAALPKGALVEIEMTASMRPAAATGAKTPLLATEARP